MSAIERKVVLNASIEKVWGLLGTPEGFGIWFKTAVHGTWSEGEIVDLVWPDGNANEIRITAINRPHHLAFQWHPGEFAKIADYPESELTTVSFRLSEAGERAELHLIEEGFEAIPDERRLRVLGLNTEGWDDELVSIRAHAEA